MQKQVIIDIDELGGVKVAAKGLPGADCAKFTKAIEEAMGETVNDAKTPEYAQRPNVGIGAGQTIKAGG